MKKIIIGYTGLVGQTLCRGIDFDYKFNSSNIQDLINVEDGCSLYLSCLPAAKWVANNEPVKDYENIISIFNLLKTKTYSEINLISTIDVYSESALGSNENNIPIVSKLGYGQNRYLFEVLVNSLACPIVKTIRLPGLFGIGLKKNLIFDLLNNHRVEHINPNSVLQWYDLKDLVKDITSLPKHSETYNLFPFPIHTSKIFELFNTVPNYNFPEGVVYDYRTKHSESHYIYDQKTCLEKLKTYINESKY